MMKLTKVRVTNFRSIEDSEPFEVGQLTCLVGKNESGKTSLLNALYRLHPHQSEDSQYDRVRDYPRRFLTEYKERHGKEAATVINTTWALEDDDRSAVREVIGPEADSLSEVQVSKTYDSKSTTWVFSVSEEKVVRHILATSSLTTDERAALRLYKTIKDLVTGLDALGTGATERHQALRTCLQKHFKRGTANLAVIDILIDRWPKFVYFSQYNRLEGRVALEALQRRKNSNQLTDSDRTMIHFCAFAGSSLDELVAIADFETLKARFEAASNKITRQIFKYWLQNRRLRVLFSRDGALPNDPPPFNSGWIFNTRIENTLHQVSVPFDDRSTGFVWFFSFLVLFSQIQKAHGDNLVLLLDEPGLSLHGKAQGDLLRFIHEQLVAKHQVIYTTHSPFMVPSDNLLSVRTVEDVLIEKDGEEPVILGTKVKSDVLGAQKDTLFPLQGALGYEITQSLFVGKNTLLVEGPSDLLYLKAYSAHLRSLGRTGLDSRWVVCPVGGIEKVGAFLSLFSGNHLRVAALIDFATGQKRQAAELARLTEVLRSGAILLASTYAGKSEADIEDLIGDEGYVALVNEVYKLVGATACSSPGGGGSTRIVRHVEEFFRSSTSLPSYDHYAPAEVLLERRSGLLERLPGATDALARCERLFRDLNGLL